MTASESFRFPTCNFIKKETQTQFLWILWIIQEHLFCTGSMSGWFWNTSAPFQEQLFYRTSPVAASESFRFPVCNFIKKQTPTKMFICEYCKIFKNISWQNTSERLLLVFIYEFWEVFQITFFIEHLWKTAYFMYSSCRISTTRYSKKVFHKNFSSILYKNKK